MVDDPSEIDRAVTFMVEHVARAHKPRRSQLVRPMTDLERRQTMFLRLALDDAAVKSRTGGPIDDPEDLDWPIEAWVVPLAMALGEFEPDSAPG